MKKIDSLGLKMCKYQANLFEYSQKNAACSSKIFIRRFMNSDLAKRMDSVGFMFDSLEIPDAIIEIESGKRKVSAEELGKFSELFHITTDELLHGNNDYTSGQIFIKNFELLDENDQKEILNLIEFKRIMKERKN